MQHIKRQVYNLHFYAGVDTKKYGRLKTELKGQANQRSFMQKYKNMTCYKCGKKGHYANKCPSGDSDDNELSTRLNLLSNCSNSKPNSIASWSG
jgi:hypothetical protein